VGLGAFVAAVSLARRPSIRGLGKWIGIAALSAGVGDIGFGLSQDVWLSAFLMTLTGFGMFMTGATCNTLLQTLVEEDKRSRVMSYYTMFFIGIAPMGHYLAGWFAEHVGVQATFIAGGGISLATGIVFLAQLPAFRAGLRDIYEKRGIAIA
jgi:MFS family permease